MTFNFNFNFNIDKNNLKKDILYIRMISGRSCDTEDWSNDVENSRE